jgi:acyl dehydratase
VTQNHRAACTLINRLGGCTLFIADRPEDLIARVGETAGPGEWIDITQARIDTFARATDDLQWIHLDASRTQKELGHAPVAHGYLTLSLMAPAMYELVQITHVGRIINYGVNKIRFIAPVLAGDRIRASATLARASREDGFVRAIFDVSVTSNRVDKPVMIAQLIILYFNQQAEAQ